MPGETKMHSTDRQLMRLLHGELGGSKARELEDRLARDGALRARYHRLQRVWEGLEPAPAAAIVQDSDFSARVMAAARRRAASELSWALAPAWARAASVAALVAGLVLGASFGVGSSGVEVAELDSSSDQEVYALAEPLSLAESYWLTLEAAGSVDETDRPGSGLPQTGDNGDERVR